MWFLSPLRTNANAPDRSGDVWHHLWVDACLVIFFVVQHSYFKTAQIADLITRLGFDSYFSRCLYVLSTSLILQALMMFWTPLFSVTVWEIDAQSNTVWVLLVAVHITAWAFIYGGALLLDFPELLGVRQVYYHFLKAPETSALKSKELQRLLSHKRHPSFLGFAVILWCTPVMSLDRLTLALLLTLYTIVSWDPTVDDTRYHQRQLLQKQQQVEYTERRSQHREFRTYQG